MAVNKTDDHLRNHGFILHTEGWELSPAYDLNPLY
ncbi:HipA domain-containing protein [Sphingobacterium phlebotomi]|nr:HipA domain-containing protein [Sphingobacterium phlebotomi]